jgi:hypothetical protein
MTQIDLIVSAKIPDPKKSPLLFARITKSMFHGPCHGRPCMKDEICSAGYPRPFTNRTVNIDGAYPIYKRRDQGITFTKHTTTFDNRWVFPYNKLLSLMFQSHINVEIPVNTTAIKHLYKYITKGHNQTYMKLGDGDEIQKYIDA